MTSVLLPCSPLKSGNFRFFKREDVTTVCHTAVSKNISLGYTTKSCLLRICPSGKDPITFMRHLRWCQFCHCADAGTSSTTYLNMINRICNLCVTYLNAILVIWEKFSSVFTNIFKMWAFIDWFLPKLSQQLWQMRFSSKNNPNEWMALTLGDNLWFLPPLLDWTSQQLAVRFSSPYFGP